MMVKGHVILSLKRFKMPAMPRLKGKSTKVAYKVLGVPGNISFKRSEAQRKINERLIFEETSRAR